MMDRDRSKLYELKAEVLAALAQPVRLAIVDALRDGELCVCDIAEAVGAQRSNVSRHLGVMLKAGVLSARKDGLKVIYKLRTPCVLQFTACVEGVLREKLEADTAVLRSL